MIKTYRLALAGLCIYGNLRQDPVLQSLASLMDENLQEAPDAVKVMEQFGEFAGRLFASGTSFREYLLDQILHDDNPFSREAESSSLAEMSREMREAVKNDLKQLQQLYFMNFGTFSYLGPGALECLPVQLSENCTDELMHYRGPVLRRGEMLLRS